MKNQRSCWVSCSLISILFPWDEVSNWTWTELVDPSLSPNPPCCCSGYRLCATTPRLLHGWWTHGLISGPHAFCSRCSYWPSHLPSLTSHFKKTKTEKKPNSMGFGDLAEVLILAGKALKWGTASPTPDLLAFLFCHKKYILYLKSITSCIFLHLLYTVTLCCFW